MRVAVVGDVMLDRYVIGDASRISPEAPVPVVLEKDRIDVLGGAGNVFNNLIGLGADALLFGVVGRDPEGEVVKSLIRKGGSTRGVLDKDVPTVSKERIVANGVQVARVDRERRCELDFEDVAFIKEKVEEYRPDAIVVSDYNKGVVSRGLVDALRGSGCLLVGDPKADLSLFEGFHMITPNERELVYTPERFREIGADHILQTLGSKGMDLFSKGYEIHIETVARSVYDVTGAGDTVVAAYTFFKCSGYDEYESACLANAAAGIVVGRKGTSPIRIEEMQEHISPFDNVKVVDKVWGSEIWFANSPLYCGKILNLSQGYKCSVHHHKKKDETFYVLSGRVLIIVNGEERVMTKGDSVRIKQQDRHSFAGILPSVILEVSTQHFDEDSYRDTTSGRWEEHERYR